MDNRKRGYEYPGYPQQPGFDPARQPGPPLKRGPAAAAAPPTYPAAAPGAVPPYVQQPGYPGVVYPQYHPGYGPPAAATAGAAAAPGYGMYAQPPQAAYVQHVPPQQQQPHQQHQQLQHHQGYQPQQQHQQHPNFQGQVQPGKPGRGDEFFLEEDGSKRPVVRIVCNPNEFSKVIGKGGSTISTIRTTHNVFIKGLDIFKDYRLLVIAGEMKNLHGACSSVVEVLEKTSSDVNQFRVTLLADQSKTGKIVGTRGTLLQALKSNSGIFAIQVNKEPTMVYGVAMRAISIDGNVHSIQKCINMISDALYGDVNFSNDNSNNSHNSHNNVSNYKQHGPASALAPSSSSPAETLSLDSLRDDVKVPSEVVNQIKYYKEYLQQYFGVNLVCVKCEPQPALPAETSALPTLESGVSADTVNEELQQLEGDAQ